MTLISTTSAMAMATIGMLWMACSSTCGVSAFVQPQQRITRTLSSSASSSTSALFSKSERARVERLLEESMGDDWRLFRAKLVAQEEDLFPFEHQDPFCSESEIPIHINVHQLSGVDRNRWAHEIPYIEPGSVVIANERLGGVFHQTVVLIVDHNDVTGTNGIVINRPLEGGLLDIVSDTNMDLSSKMCFKTSRVAYGGPLNPEHIAILHNFGHVEGSKKLCPGIFIGGIQELAQETRMKRFNPDEALFIKGHTSWEPGALQTELERGIWYQAAVSSSYLLRYARSNTPDEITKEGQGQVQDDLWYDILMAMGGKYSEIARTFGGRDHQRLMP